MPSRLSVRDSDLIRRALASVPSPDLILEAAIRGVNPQLNDAKWVRRHFSEAVITLERTAYETYLELEAQGLERLIDSWVEAHETDLEATRQRHLNGLPKEFLSAAMKKFAPIAVTWEFHAGQRRKARGGGTFERVLEVLLRLLSIPCGKPAGKARNTLKRIDFVVPDQQTALRNPDRAFFISCKRTLRERWKQTIPERQPSWRVYIVTSDKTLPEDKAREIDKLGMVIYVRDELQREAHLADMPWVRPLSALPRDLKR